MSIFPTLIIASNWTPIVSTTAPQTVVIGTISMAQYGLFGNVCFFKMRASATIGGVLSAAAISFTAPIIGNTISGIPFVANIFLPGGIPIVGRGQFNTGSGIDFFKAADGGDAVWAAGLHTFFGAGFYTL